MNVFCDTSFLLSVYLTRGNSEQASETLRSLNSAVPVTSLLLFELENAIRLGAFRLTCGESTGISPQVAQSALAQVEVDLGEGRLRRILIDHERVLGRARDISDRRTWKGGHRTMDILLVATALTLGAPRFLSFDVRQREFAEAEGLDVRH